MSLQSAKMPEKHWSKGFCWWKNTGVLLVAINKIKCASSFLLQLRLKSFTIYYSLLFLIIYPNMGKSFRTKSIFSKPFHPSFFIYQFIHLRNTRRLWCVRYLSGSGLTTMSSTDSLALWSFLLGGKDRQLKKQYKKKKKQKHPEVIMVQKD